MRFTASLLSLWFMHSLSVSGRVPAERLVCSPGDYSSKLPAAKRQASPQLAIVLADLAILAEPKKVGRLPRPSQR